MSGPTNHASDLNYVHFITKIILTSWHKFIFRKNRIERQDLRMKEESRLW